MGTCFCIKYCHSRALKEKNHSQYVRCSSLHTRVVYTEMVQSKVICQQTVLLQTPIKFFSTVPSLMMKVLLTVVKAVRMVSQVLLVVTLLVVSILSSMLFITGGGGLDDNVDEGGSVMVGEPGGENSDDICRGGVVGEPGGENSDDIRGGGVIGEAGGDGFDDVLDSVGGLHDSDLIITTFLQGALRCRNLCRQRKQTKQPERYPSGARVVINTLFLIRSPFGGVTSLMIKILHFPPYSLKSKEILPNFSSSISILPICTLFSARGEKLFLLQSCFALSNKHLIYAYLSKHLTFYHR